MIPISSRKSRSGYGVWWIGGNSGYGVRWIGGKESCWKHFETMAILFTPLCLGCLEETLKGVGPVYMLSTPSGNKRRDTKKRGSVSIKKKNH